MTHNKYFFSGRLEEVRAKPGGGNVQQTYVHESDPAGPHEKDVVPLASTADPFGNPSYNLNPMLLEAIRMSDPFWDLSKHTQFSAVIDAIYYEVHYATPWVPGTHKANKAVGMQSTVRGVSNAGTPGLAYTFLLKLYIMKLTVPQARADFCESRARAARRGAPTPSAAISRAGEVDARPRRLGLHPLPRLPLPAHRCRVVQGAVDVVSPCRAWWPCRCCGL